MLGSTRCPRCAKHLPADAAFCRRCGRDLRAPHGLAGAATFTAALPRRAVPPPPLPTRPRVNGGFAILAFAVFAMLFIFGALFSARSVKTMPPVAPAPPPAETSVEEGGGSHHDSENTPGGAEEKRSSGKDEW